MSELRWSEGRRDRELVRVMEESQCLPEALSGMLWICLSEFEIFDFVETLAPLVWNKDTTDVSDVHGLQSTWRQHSHYSQANCFSPEICAMHEGE